MNIRPLSDRIVVKRIEAPTQTASGIIIPDNAKEKPIEGEVVAAGVGKVLDNGRLLEVSVKVGERVLFGKYAGTEVRLGNGTEEYTILSESEVLAVVG